MKGYWLILADPLQDEAAQAEYGALWAPIAEAFGARLLRGDDAPELLEGRDTAKVVLVEFLDIEAARTCYRSDAYQAAILCARKAAPRDLVIFEGTIA